MICGLVDVEFLKLVMGSRAHGFMASWAETRAKVALKCACCKLRMHKEEGALDKFYNANINLATGLQARIRMQGSRGRDLFVVDTDLRRP